MTCDIKIAMISSVFYEQMQNFSSLKGSSVKKKEIDRIIGINTPLISPGTLYYVKYNNLSYRDCNFITREELLSHKNGKELETKLRKQPSPFRPVAFMKGLFKPFTYKFDEGYIKPEKIISDQYKSGRHQYLVKWISLDYDEATWEDKDNNISQSLIHEYFTCKEKFNEAYSKNYIGSLYPPKFQYIDQKRTMPQIANLAESIQSKNGRTLSQLQIEGINWIHKNWILHQNSILADQIGLGKSIQSLCFLSLLKKKYGICGTFLILTSLVNVEKWIFEIEEWTSFRVVSLTGNCQSRNIIEEYCLYYNKNDQSKLIFDILIVPIEFIQREFDILKKIYFMCLIIDQSFSQLKSTNSNLYKQCEEIKTDFTLLLTDSFFQNNNRELWSILHFIDPKNFLDFDSFDSKYFKKDDQTIFEKLNQHFKQYVLSRSKENSNEIEETIIEVELTSFQRLLINAILTEKRGFLIQEILKSKNLMINITSEIRKVCDHPYLIKDAEPAFIEQFKKKQKSSKKGKDSSDELILNALIFASGKTIFLDKFLQSLRKENHKIIIFSQIKQMIDILDHFLYLKNYQFERIDGFKNLNSKKFSIENFKTNPESFILLFSEIEDSFVLNQTDVDTVIIFDSDKKPQNDRIFQLQKKVNVFRLIMKNSYEEVLFDYLSKRLNINAYDSIEEQLTSSEIEMILRKSSYYTLSEKEVEIENFSEEDITQILKNRSYLFNFNSVDDEKSRFSFNSKKNRHDENETNFDSPNFWLKLLPTETINLPEISETQEAKENGHHKFSSDEEKETEKIQKSDSESESEEEEENKKLNRRKFYNKYADYDKEIKMGSIESSDSDSDELFEDNSLSLFRKKSKNSSNQNEIQSQLFQKKELILTKGIVQNLKIRAESEKQYLQLNIIRPALSLLFNFGLYGSRFIKNSPMKEFSQYFLLSLVFYISKNEVEKENFLNYIKNIKPDILSKIDSISIINPNDLSREEVVFQGIIKLTTKYREIENMMKYKTESNGELDPGILNLLKNEIAPNICCLIWSMKDKSQILENLTKKIKIYDSSYRVAIYISNEVLPSNFYFAPAVPFSSFPYWNVEMDFTFFCASIFYGMLNLKHVFTDPKLPFSLINQQIFPNRAYLNTKFQIILREVESIMPKNYKVEGKTINDISYFKLINWRLFNKTVISLNMKKQIFRGLYYYGLPSIEKSKSSKNILKKLKFIFHSDEIEDFTFMVFISSLLSYAKKFQPEIIVGPFNIPTRVVIRMINKETKEETTEIIEPNSKSSPRPFKILIDDLRWLDIERVKDFADNLLLFQKVRNHYEYFNKKFAHKSHELLSLSLIPNLCFPNWHSYMKEVPVEWNNNCDVNLFNITAYYGFLLFSELGRVLTKIPPQSISVWRLNELMSLRPLKPAVAEQIAFLYPLQNRIDRLEVIIKVIENSIEVDKLPNDFNDIFSLDS